MTLRALVAGMACLLAAGAAIGQAVERDYTCFQTGSGYAPTLDIGSDMAVVYGVDESFADRVASWRDRGYAIGMMTGIAWGGYHEYFGTGGSFKRDEVQTLKDGSLRLHGPDIGYNVPTPGYIEFMKKRIEPAVDAGARIIFLEEPEYWANTGWSEAFKREWQAFYGEPWEAPDTSPDTQWRASWLKYELYFKALREVFAHAEARARAQGRTVECAVPTHSLINYAQWGIVSPESHLIDIPELDGYVAQVWTGTARTPNFYAGVRKERSFENGFLEYGQMFNMVRPTGKKVWFLADPVEDNPNRSWNDYKRNYECTIVASLLWPGVSRFEVMPWPDRIFNGKYPKLDMDAASGDREGIPAEYATELLTVINALNEMEQPDVARDTGTSGIGVVVSDTLMFQRGEPSSDDPTLASFYGLAMPLVKAGVPVEPVQLENVLQAGALEPYKVLLLTYEGQKPLKAAYHEAIDAWVRAGGGLIFVEDGSDPYHGTRAWWSKDGQAPAKAYDDLFRRLGVADEAGERPQKVGEGYVRVVRENPSALARRADGGDRVRGLVKEMLAALGGDWREQNYLKVQRGPFVVAAVMDESVSDAPLRIEGRFVDLFDPTLPVLREKVLEPDSRGLLYDLDWAQRQGLKAKVVAAGTRVRGERFEGGAFRFTTRGPEATTARARIVLPKEPAAIATQPEVEVQREWDADSSTLRLTFPNMAQDVVFTLSLE